MRSTFRRVDVLEAWAFGATNTKPGVSLLQRRPAFAACTCGALFPQPVDGADCRTRRQLRASSRQSWAGRKHHDARRIQKYFRRV